MNVTDLALRWAERGVHVFPIAFTKGGKTPLRGCDRCSPSSPAREPHDGSTCPCHQEGGVCHGLLAATTDPARIRKMFSRKGAAGVGINCGMSGLIVVDCDTPREGEDKPSWMDDGFTEDGEELFVSYDIYRDGRPFAATSKWAGKVFSGDDRYHAVMESKGAEHVPTFTVRTPSGGVHYLYADEGATVPSSSDISKVDIKANGGYVIAAGSSFGAAAYTPEEPVIWPPAPLPQWLRSHLGATRARKATQFERVDPDVVEVWEVRDPEQWLDNKLTEKVDEMARVKRGDLHPQIARVTMSLAPFVKGGGLTPGEVIAALQEAVAHTPVRFPNVERCLHDALGKVHAIRLEKRPEPEFVYDFEFDPDCRQIDSVDMDEGVAARNLYLRVIRKFRVTENQRHAVPHAARGLGPVLEAGWVPAELLVRHLTRYARDLTSDEVRELASEGFRKWKADQS